MFGYIVIAIIAIILAYKIRKSNRKGEAERLMREYPNAMKGLFGFYKEISLDNENTIDQILAPAHTEEYWRKKEEEEAERLARCNKLKADYPNGWESWKQLGHQDNFQDLYLVDKESETIKKLESVYAQYKVLEGWKSSQEALTDSAISQAGYSLSCEVKSSDRFGKDFLDSFPVAHLYTKEESCKSENIELGNNQSASVESIIECARQIDDNIMFLLTPDCFIYSSLFESLDVDAINIADINNWSWDDNQSFAILTTTADMQQVKHLCEILFEEMDSHPLLIAFSLVMTQSDTEYNLEKYKSYSPDHNQENSYALDDLIEIHPYKDAYYFTVKDQACKSVKKAISTCFKEFDTDTMASHTCRKYRFDSTSQYYGKTAEEIKEMWAEKRDASARANRKLRDDIMRILSNQGCERDETTSLFEMFNKEWKISPYRTNWPIFDLQTGIVATVDCLAYMDGKFILYSWIRTDSAINTPWLYKLHKRYLMDDSLKKTYKKSYGDFGLSESAFSYLRDCKLTKYSIEQEIIKYILNKNYGISVEENYIVILHPKYKEPIGMRGDQVSKEVERFMITEARNNPSKPTIETEYKESDTAAVTEEDLESVELMELF